MPSLSLWIAAGLGGLSLGLLLVLARTVLGLRRELRAQARRQARLAEDLAAACSGGARLAAEAQRLEGVLHQLKSRLDRLEAQDPADAAYRRAAREARRGASVEELMEDCGIARGEAELLVLAQRLKQAS